MWTFANTAIAYFGKLLNRTKVIRWPNIFIQNCRGNVAMMFALALIPVLLAVGAAIDYNRASRNRAQVQNALDAAALAVGAMPASTSQSDLEARGTAFFDANFTAPSGVTYGALQIIRAGNTITLNLPASVDTSFMGLVGINDMSFNLDTEIILGGGTLEVALVLDNSGSMSGSKLSALQDAAGTLVDTMFQNAAPGTDDLKFSLVPFATFVDVGTVYAGVSWMDTQGLSPVHSENFSAPANRFDLYNNIANVQWEGCVEARPYPHDVSDTPPNAANPETLFVPSFAPDHPDTGGPSWKYPNRYLADATGGSTLVRQENIGKYYPGVAAIPGYYGTTYNIGPAFLCNQRELLPLTETQATIQTGINSMMARGSTNIIEGLAWGWRTLSPGEPFTEGRVYTDNNNQKVLILLTDGQNMLSPVSSINKSLYSAYGFVKDGRVGTTSSSQSQQNSMMNARTAETCENVKASGIKIYTITFDLTHQATLDLMRDCATSAAHYFNSPNASDLDDIFGQIAAELVELRISR